MADLVGQSLAHFRVVAKIGEGGMGIVYKATDERLGRAVALKVLPESLAQDAERRKRFLREARSAAALTHANIATVHDIGEEAGFLYIAMELVEGESLRALVERGLSLPEAIRIAVGVAAGLARAHEGRIIHRDLKPENVMISPRGEVKVLDFGLAKLHEPELDGAAALGSADTRSLITREGNVMGTPSYMSPEQARGGLVDARSDVFAFGVMLYEMLAGTRPFEGDTAFAVLYAVATLEPEPVSRWNPAVAPELERLVARCLQKQPTARYANGQKIVEALQELAPASFTSRPSGRQVGVGVGVSTASDATRAPPPRRPLRWRFAAFGAALFVAGAILVPRLRTPRPAPTADTAPSPPAVAPTAITDLPPPRTGVPEAAREFASAMQAWRDGSAPNGNDHLRRALALDPGFPAAHLELALAASATPDDMRRHVAAAAAQRALLTDRDAARLAALQTDLTTDKVDFEASARRLRELADRFPGDAELAMRAGEGALETLHPADGLALLERATRLDPKFALPYVIRGSYQVGAGDLSGAVTSADACLAVAPSAASCLRLRAAVEVRLGQCDAFAADAHTMTTMEPEGAYSYYARMDALVAQGAPEASIAETMRRSLAFETDPLVHADREACDPALLATLSGDFTAAIATFPTVEAFIGGMTSDAIVGLDTQWMMNILDEAGQPERALALADGYMKRVPALTEDDAAGWGRCATLRRWHKAGRITDAEFRARREEWAEWGKARMSARYANSAWLYFYAGTVTSAEDAKSALLVLPRYSPLPPYDGETYLERAMGNTLLLAGRVDEAIPHLRRGAAACLQADHINAHQGAAKLLGEALEAKGDVAGACAAYAEVRVHWGHARPRSVTADAARARMQKLGCPR